MNLERKSLQVMDGVVSTPSDNITKRSIGLHLTVKTITGTGLCKCSQSRTDLVSRKT